MDEFATNPSSMGMGLSIIEAHSGTAPGDSTPDAWRHPLLRAAGDTMNVGFVRGLRRRPGGERSMLNLSPRVWPKPPASLRYGVAVVSVVAALITVWLMETVWQSAAHVSLFLCAVMLSAWFGGVGPGLLAVALSVLTFDYFFLPPIFSLAVEIAQLPRLILFALSALLVGSLSAAQRRAAESVRHARDDLQETLEALQQTNESLRVENVERTRAEGTLREQAHLLDLTHDTVFVRDTNDVITYWNRGAAELYGWTSEQAVGKVTHQLLQTRFPGPLEQITEQLLRAGRWEGELVHTRRDGTQVIVASRWALQRDEGGRPVAVLETNNDITERKRADEERRQFLAREQAAKSEAVAAQHRFRDLVNSIEGIVWEADAQTFRFLFVSEQAQRVLGYPVERWLNEPAFWKDHIHPDDREWAVNFCMAATAEKRDHDFEYRMLAADGRTVWLRDLVTVVAEGDRTTRLRGVMLDITERKRAEYLTRQVFETSPDSVVVVGKDYRYQRVNPVYERIWGIPAEKLVGMHVADLVGMEVFEQSVKLHLDRCFAGEDVSYGRWFTNSVGRRYMAVSYSPLRPDWERVEAVLVIARDLTEYMLAEEALHQAQAELAHVTRLTTLGELAASIAHEVNQPLAAIVADANASLNWLAAARPDLDMVRDALVAIVKDGHRAADVIQRTRQLARKAYYQKAQLDINDVIRDVVPLVRTAVLNHQVSLRVDLASGLAPVLADRVQLQQVLINLVMNGIEAMASVDDRPRELVVRSRAHEADQILVAVQDVGVGIDSISADRLFSAFFTTKPGGMGMGLSISRSIIEAHGGRLWATPNEGPGATFQFAVPHHQA
jgi:PAS domain S-box-containing protein